MTTKTTLRIVLAALSLGLLAAGAAQGSPAGPRYVFRGHLLASPAAGATSISISVEGGNRIALKKMLGAPVDQSFAVGADTEFLKWTNGVPKIVAASDLAAGDWVAVGLRAPRNASLADVEAKPAGVVADRGPDPSRPDKPLYLFRGKVAAAAGGTTLTVDVRGGNRRALMLLIGSTRQQAFTYGPETIFLRWQGRVPTVIAASDLKVGDPVVVRVRAAAGSTLAQVESTPAVHVGEHEPPATKITS
jgi:hypothetical protein